LFQFASMLVLILAQLAVAIMLSPPLTALTLAFAGGMLLYVKPLNREARDTGEGFRLSRQNLYAAVMEHMSGMKTAKGFGVEQQHLQRIAAINRQIESQVLGFARSRANTRFYYEIAGVLFLTVFLWAAVELLHVPTTRFLLLAFIFVRLLPRFSSLQQQYQSVKNMLPAFAGVTELHARASAARETGLEGTGEPHPLTREVSFRNVSFRYDRPDGPYALENATFDIPAHKITAIVGPSGAGKSTLADLLLGLLKPQRGMVMADGREISADRLSDWRHAIGYVPQEAFLFHDTLRANLLWANPSATEEDLWEALRLAAADDFVAGLPGQLDTLAGDRGLRLSGGERQRIALARALLRKPQLLLLDEATSALDNCNEDRIHAAVQTLRGALTIVIIAHRSSTLRHADHVIVLERGRVKETGSWDTISQNPDGVVRRMITAESTAAAPDGADRAVTP
jgi:ATP-binding cassette, subfamily C, bacterial